MYSLYLIVREGEGARRDRSRERRGGHERSGSV